MAKFDISGCPSEFVTLIRNLETGIEDKKNRISKQKQLIEDVEKQISDKLKLTKAQEVKNAELESSIEHMNALHRKQVEDNRRLSETRELLKDQVKFKCEKLKAIQAKNEQTRSDCDAKYRAYADEFVTKMSFFESLPLVPEYKAKMQEIIEMRELVQKGEQEILVEEIARLRARKDDMKPRTTLCEWALKLASLHREYDSREELALQKEIAELQQQQAAIREKQLKEKQAATERVDAEPARTEAVQAKVAEQAIKEISPIESHLPTSRHSAPDAKRYAVPDFLSFFKDRPVKNHKRGSSGSSIVSYSAPKLNTRFSTSKRNQVPAVRSCEDDGDGPSMASEPLSAAESSEQSQPSVQGGFKTGRSLAEWLSPPPPISKVSPKKSSNEGGKPTKETRAKEHRASWPLTSGYTHARVTEVPLLRQVQEKMLQSKMTQEKEIPCADTETPSGNVEDLPTDVEMTETGDESKSSPDDPRAMFFDGPTYEVPVPNEEEEMSDKSMKSPRRSQSPKHVAFQEHQRMMAELQKSPEDFFRFQSNIMPMTGSDDSFLIPATSPRSKSDPQSSTTCDSNSSANNFHFAVPSEPPPGHSNRNGSISPRKELPTASHQAPPGFGAFSFAEGFQDESSQPTFAASPFNSTEPETPTTDSVFSFAFADNNKMSPGDAASIFSGKNSSVQSPESSVFSFAFADNNKTNPGDAASIFSGNSSVKSPESSTVSFFSIGSDDKEESSSTSFASIFGC